jgi:hypothetical protein
MYVRIYIRIGLGVAQNDFRAMELEQVLRRGWGEGGGGGGAGEILILDLIL